MVFCNDESELGTVSVAIPPNMLKKIISIKNVALFHQVQSGGALSLDCKRTTLIYGDNASGKSSLSAIFRSASTRDVTAILRRKTNDQAGPQEIKLLFDSPADFNGTAWTGAKPKIEVFDSEFVAENVYAGHAITTEHRRNLFVFALGDSVADQQKLDQLTKDATEAARKMGERKRALEPLAKPYQVDQFNALTVDSDIDTKIAENQKEIDAANNSTAIIARKLPEKLQEVQFDETAFFAALKTTLPEIEAKAEQVMQEHLAKHKTADYADWLLQGNKHQLGDECPYCAQPLDKIEIVGVYKSYFNAAYVAHKEKLDKLKREVSVLAEKLLLSWEGILKANASTADAWASEYVCSLPAFDLNSFNEKLKTVRDELTQLTEQKVASPLEILEAGQAQIKATEVLEEVRAAVTLYNAAIDLCNTGIGTAKKKVTAANKPALETRKTQLAAEKKRFDPLTVKAVGDFQDAEKESLRLDAEKKALKLKIDAQMVKALSSYMVKINEYLKRFSAKFSIVKLAPTYLGGGKPRTEFALEVRGKEVSQLEKDASRPGFDTVLSEGDKRTLAFAFFMAKLSGHSNLNDYIVVFDDPVTSLDIHRRRETLKVFDEVAKTSKQLIVLSHDLYFLKDAGGALAGAATWKICHAPHNYSGFAALDLEEMCRSVYEKNYELLSDYFHGKYVGDDRNAAIALRPTVEGYFNKRYPGAFDGTTTFGSMIEHIAKNSSDSRFASLSPATLTKLRDFNDYARCFHHDSGGDYVAGSPNPTEVKKYAEIALGIIHTDGLKP